MRVALFVLCIFAIVFGSNSHIILPKIASGIKKIASDFGIIHPVVDNREINGPYKPTSQNFIPPGNYGQNFNPQNQQFIPQNPGHHNSIPQNQHNPGSDHHNYNPQNQQFIPQNPGSGHHNSIPQNQHNPGSEHHNYNPQNQQFIPQNPGSGIHNYNPQNHQAIPQNPGFDYHNSNQHNPHQQQPSPNPLSGPQNPTPVSDIHAGGASGHAQYEEKSESTTHMFDLRIKLPNNQDAKENNVRLDSKPASNPNAAGKASLLPGPSFASKNNVTSLSKDGSVVFPEDSHNPNAAAVTNALACKPGQSYAQNPACGKGLDAKRTCEPGSQLDENNDCRPALSD